MSAREGWEEFSCPWCGLFAKRGFGRFVCPTCELDIPETEFERRLAEHEDRPVCLANVAPEEVRFLWRPRLPLGKLTILEGDPGQGKSFLTAALAAAISRGSGLPETPACEPASVLIYTVEDGIADTLRPRLDSMEADSNRIFAYAAPFDLSMDKGLGRVRNDIDRHTPSFVVFDPISAYVGIGTDTHKANQVRAVLGPIAHLAESEGCAVLVVRHLTKDHRGKAIYRGLGSIDFTAAARSVLLAGSPPGDPRSWALVHIKCNVAELAPTLGYSIEGGVFEWTGESSLTASDILAGEGLGTGGRIGEACEFLRDVLSDGAVSAAEILAMAKDAGIAERTLRDAKKREGVEARKTGFSDGWFWYYPDTEESVAETIPPVGDNSRRLQPGAEGCKGDEFAAFEESLQPSGEIEVKL